MTDTETPAPTFDSPDEARPPDDDLKWRRYQEPLAEDPAARKAQLLSNCESQIDNAFNASGSRPRVLADAIGKESCTALKGKGRDCIKCRICPKEEAWLDVAAYFRPSKGKILVCAEKEPTLDQVERALTHELVHAFDHCRFGMRVPMVGWQAPWALSCAATACAEVRAHLLGSLRGLNRGNGQVFGGTSEDVNDVYGRGGYMRDSNGLRSGNDFNGGLDGSNGGDFSNDSRFANDGSPGGENDDGDGVGRQTPAALQHGEIERTRQAVYAGAFSALSGWGRCREEGREPRAVLDAVFNACMADDTPLQSSHGAAGNPFPPMPPAVDAAERMGQEGSSTPGAGAPAADPPNQQQRVKWGNV